MDNQGEVRTFLTTRRDRLTPDQAGVAMHNGRRRVKGLRREEVAMLAGMSTDYYTRLERGNLSGASQSVLDALARALQLDESERIHLFDLAAVANGAGRTVGASAPSRSPRPAGQPRVREGIKRIIDSMSAPAYVRNTRGDILYANALCRALFSPAYSDDADGFNMARFLFLDPRSRDFYIRWEKVARDLVAALRVEAGKNPYDRALTDLVGELSTRSEEFRTWWAAHHVKLHTRSTKKMHHPAVGEIELTGEALTLPGDPGLVIITYTVEPNSASKQALSFLASWTGQPHAAETSAPDPANSQTSEFGNPAQ
ncbi:helix-turn-helix transcriptional regulator [Kineosporia mesophila]|uniref:Helix-turn-helix transcriptional regulator n=1 Tax=Kineosporia mesophila TaxID=566012 RepID=A0ABP6ZQI1_9ACTN|nr:helix-turn-helix transcriptional regulator [Kineosporia mesophila]MCD5354447.1 helix-turn-helix transcriptional regulator [Kineosporia mesophila]